MYSCGRPSIAGTINAKREKAEFLTNVSRDSSFSLPAPINAYYTDLQIVNNSLLLLQKNGDEFYDVFNLRTNEFLTSLAHKGRAKGEFLSPYLSHVNPDRKYLSLTDNSLSRFFLIDVPASVSDNRVIIVNEIQLPNNTVDAIPVSDSSCFAILSNGGCFYTAVFDCNGQAITEFEPYSNPKLDADSHAAFLSGIMAYNKEKNRIAIALVCFPQLLLIDSQGKAVRTISVSKESGNWRGIVDRGFDMSTRQYYAGICSSPDHLFASYWACPIEKTIVGGHNSCIHVFNWEGEFLYRINLTEDIGPIAFDSKTGILYGIDKTEGKVLKYNLAFILNHKP